MHHEKALAWAFSMIVKRSPINRLQLYSSPPHTYWLEIMNNEGRVVVTHYVEIVRESWREKSLVTTVMKYVNCKSKVLPRAGGIISIHLSKKVTFRYT